MSDKPVAGLVTLAAILPLCAICVLRPAAMGAVLASASVWLGASGLWAALLASVAGAELAGGLWRRRFRKLPRPHRST